MIFSSIFLHAVTFSHVLHLDVLKSQIGLKLKVKTEISLCMAIMQNNPLPSLHSTTVLCDNATLLCMYIHYNAGAGYSHTQKPWQQWTCNFAWKYTE